jgi:hypothetical protein
MNTPLTTPEQVAAAHRELAARIIGFPQVSQELLDIADELERVEDLP